jgi:RNA polymerase sigma-70 factor (ECF subfamily)
MSLPATVRTDDREFIERYLRGDERAAAELVHRHTTALGRFLAVQGAPDEELDDLVQDTFVKAFRALGGYRGGASFRTWLLTIGSNLLKDRRKRWRRRQVVELSPEVADPSADPASDADASWAMERLGEGLGRLTRLQREVFLLRAQQGTDYQEIARALEMSEGAARVHYHHAVKRLKAWMS